MCARQVNSLEKNFSIQKLVPGLNTRFRRYDNQTQIEILCSTLPHTDFRMLIAYRRYDQTLTNSGELVLEEHSYCTNAISKIYFE